MRRYIGVILIIGCWVAVFVALPPEGAAASQALRNANQAGLDAQCARIIRDCQAALKANPSDAVAHNKLGICYQRSERLGAAVKEYKQAVRLDGRYAEAWNNLGSVYHGQKKLKDAVKQYRRAIALKPEMAVAHKNLGSALFAMGKIEDGVAALRRAYELNPLIFGTTPANSFAATGVDLATQYYYLAKFSAAGGRIDIALDFLKKARAAGFHDFTKVARDPDFKDVVSDARYWGLLQ